ncbi:hypothetical protein [Nesterenkonia muleiensis]|uniref:hypothetical protein n=1 Tax=Nesterenkonia muleiensis TaxID=2282648 RepID=UPI000E740FA9|nr:hypothetical protein [Nesterenkonia muleiensis]
MSKRRKKTRGNPQQHTDRGNVPKQPAEKKARPAPQEQGSPRILVYALLGVALFMGLYLHAYAMPQLTYFADGLSMPGARITGYDAADILALQAAFEDDAAGQLNFLHKTAGIIFPVVFFLATWAALGLLARGVWRWAVVAAAAGFAAVDITGNFLVDAVLGHDPPEPTLVTLASVLTQISWVLLVLLSVTVVGVVVRDVVVTGRRDKPQG